MAQNIETTAITYNSTETYIKNFKKLVTYFLYMHSRSNLTRTGAFELRTQTATLKKNFTDWYNLYLMFALGGYRGFIAPIFNNFFSQIIIIKLNILFKLFLLFQNTYFTKNFQNLVIMTSFPAVPRKKGASTLKAELFTRSCEVKRRKCVF